MQLGEVGGDCLYTFGRLKRMAPDWCDASTALKGTDRVNLTRVRTPIRCNLSPMKGGQIWEVRRITAYNKCRYGQREHGARRLQLTVGGAMKN